jgi:hypothetical protein
MTPLETFHMAFCFCFFASGAFNVVAFTVSELASWFCNTVPTSTDSSLREVTALCLTPIPPIFSGM